MRTQTGNILVAIVGILASSTFSATAAYADDDPFGIEELYGTKDDDSAWFMEDDDPEPEHDNYDDGFPFHFGTLHDIEDLDDMGNGVWKMDVETGSKKHGVRMHVDHPEKDEWRDMEMTGYFKLLESKDEITMIARHGGSYRDNHGCDALGYYGMLSSDGDAFFKKKLYHGNGGYSDKVAVEENVVDDMDNEWVGVKFVVYNVGDNEVKLELWVDDGNEENDWEKVTEYVDDGDLEINGDSKCDRDTDYVIDGGQPRATFRLDDSKFEFKDLSVREIEH